MTAQLYCIFLAILSNEISLIDKQFLSALCIQDWLRYRTIFGDVPFNNVTNISLTFPADHSSLDDGGIPTTF